MDIFEEIVQARKSNQPVVLATVIESSGSAPREEGARMLVRPDGSIAGTIGGGAVEKKIIEEALQLMKGGQAKLLDYTLKDIGMECGGGMKVFVEPLVPAPQLLIFGAGHIGACLAQIGKMLEFSVTVIDNRPEFANAERLPWADTIIADEYAAAAEKAVFNDRAYVVILTHKHAHDYEVLELCLKKTWRYLGMIGSRAKVAKVFDQLRAKGVSDELIQKIHSPVGIKIGANTPAEIAISILAEIIQARSTVSETPRGCPSEK
jgi:xanthine dehydrogenase accessory factor